MSNLNRNRKLLITLLSVVVGCVVLFYTGRYILYFQIRKAITNQLDDLKEKGIDIQYDDFDFDVLTGKLEFYQFNFSVHDDSAQVGLGGKIPLILIKGVDIIPFLTNNTLAIQAINLNDASVFYHSGAKLFNADTVTDKKEKKLKLENIDISRISLSGLNLLLKDSLGKDTIAHLSGNLNIRELGMERQHDSLLWHNADIRFDNVALSLIQEYYNAEIKSMHLSVHDKKLIFDSLTIKPAYPRQTFMRKVGKQTDHISAVVPYLKIEGIDWYTSPARGFDIATVKLQMSLTVFRDKNYPFVKDKTTLLPSHSLHQIPILIKIDTVELKDSYVSYEEMPEKGDSSGRVFFEKLNATITSVHNNPDFEQPVLMKASAMFMGAGFLNASFSFPYTTAQPYYASGSLRKFPMNSLNNMVGSAAQVRIESGQMHALEFDFNYNMNKSDGKVVLHYEDLKISSLRENNDNEQAVSFFKTFLLNTFLIKKEMTKDMDKDKRTGTISFDRDQHRSLFNYWWKSVLSGVISAFNLDKLVPKKTEPKK